VADKGLSITIDDQETYRMIEKLIRKIDDPKPLLQVIGRYIRAQTKKMFVGRRPDTGGVRGEKWQKLANSTIRKKLAMKKNGGVAGNARRPLVETGMLKDDLLSNRSIKIKNKGLEYGTDRRSNKGFPYPGIHQTGGNNLPQRRWLFLTKDELMQIAVTTRDWLKGLQSKRIE
jgi:phage gpG-like protein